MKPYISRNKIIEKEKKIVYEGGKFRLYKFNAKSNILFLINIYKLVLIKNKKVHIGPNPSLFQPSPPQKIIIIIIIIS